MGTMIPVDNCRDAVNAHPRNRRLVVSKLGQLLDLGFLFRDGGVTRHAAGHGWKRHVVAWIGIGMAFLTFQRHRRVRLVAEGNGLYWLVLFWLRLRLSEGRHSQGQQYQDSRKLHHVSAMTDPGAGTILAPRDWLRRWPDW